MGSNLGHCMLHKIYPKRENSNKQRRKNSYKNQRRKNSYKNQRRKNSYKNLSEVDASQEEDAGKYRSRSPSGHTTQVKKTIRGSTDQEVPLGTRCSLNKKTNWGSANQEKDINIPALGSDCGLHCHVCNMLFWLCK